MRACKARRAFLATFALDRRASPVAAAACTRRSPLARPPPRRRRPHPRLPFPPIRSRPTRTRARAPVETVGRGPRPRGAHPARDGADGDGHALRPGLRAHGGAATIAAVGDGDGPAPEGRHGRSSTRRGKFVTPGIIDPHSHMGVYPVPDDRGPRRRQRADRSHHRRPARRALVLAAGPRARARRRGRRDDHRRAARAAATSSAGAASCCTCRRSGARARCASRARPRSSRWRAARTPSASTASMKRAPSTRMGNVRARARGLHARPEVRARLGRLDAQAAQPHAPARRTGEKADKAATSDDKPPDRDLALETLALVMRGDILVEWHCYQADDMLAALQVADEFGFKVRAFHHALEAYKIRDVLAQKGVAVATWDDWWGFKMEAYDGIPENLALVTEAGGARRRALRLGHRGPDPQPVRRQGARRGARRGREARRRRRHQVAHGEPRVGARHRRPGGHARAGQARGRRRVEREPAQHVRAGRARLHRRAAGVRSRPRRRAAGATSSSGSAAMPAEGEEASEPRRSVRSRLVARDAALARRGAPSSRSRRGRSRPSRSRTRACTCPGGQPPLEDATVVIDERQGARRGHGRRASPPGARVIDARGKVVTPGFIDAETDVGVVDVDLEAATNDTDVRAAMTPGAAHGRRVQPALGASSPSRGAGGVTSVVVAPRARSCSAGRARSSISRATRVAEAIVRPVARAVRAASTSATAQAWRARAAACG